MRNVNGVRHIVGSSRSEGRALGVFADPPWAPYTDRANQKS
jgi:hypothetical protein